MVAYNALPWLEQALESVRGVETVVVDNGSTDGTVEFVRERFPEVELVEAENRGLAAGWNAGIERTDGRYVLLLNSDAWLDPGSLDVVRADERPGEPSRLAGRRSGVGVVRRQRDAEHERDPQRHCRLVGAHGTADVPVPLPRSGRRGQGGHELHDVPAHEEGRHDVLGFVEHGAEHLANA